MPGYLVDIYMYVHIYIYIVSVCPLVMSDFVTPWIVACQALLYMEFSRQEYWSRLPFPSPRDLPNPGIKPGSLALLADSFPLYHLGNRNETSGFERGCIGNGTPAQS